ncbi:hypothetical protein K502DRAFT_87416 [Neoconidiobolus thromboides FSU 785]|nr:hypothetical protein K502DRAFT_87416 [Neoconidiobolus thromboides FSU 785]
MNRIKESILQQLNEFSQENNKLKTASSKVNNFIEAWTLNKIEKGKEYEVNFNELKENMNKINEYKVQMFQDLSDSSNETLDKAIQLQEFYGEQLLGTHLDEEKTRLELLQSKIIKNQKIGMETFRQYEQSDKENTQELEQKFNNLNEMVKKVLNNTKKDMNEQLNHTLKLSIELKKELSEINLAVKDQLEVFNKDKKQLLNLMNQNLNHPLNDQQFLQLLDIKENNYPTSWPRTDEERILQSINAKREMEQVNDREIENNLSSGGAGVEFLSEIKRPRFQEVEEKGKDRS